MDIWHSYMKNFFRIFWKFILLPGCILFIPYFLYRYFVSDGITIQPEQLTSYQFHHLRITFFSSLLTLCALIVALFKDEIRLLWHYTKLVIEPKESDFLVETTINTNTDIGIRAKHYEVILFVTNKGSLTAKDCKISLAELTFSNSQQTESEIDVSLAPEIIWLGKNSNNTSIVSHGGKAQISILKIVPKTEGVSTKEEKGDQSKPNQLFISGIDVSSDKRVVDGCKWIATFLIFSDNSKPLKYKIEIMWNGEWHNRKSEMMNCFKVKKK